MPPPISIAFEPFLNKTVFLLVLGRYPAPGIDSGRFDSFRNFCGRARRIEQKVKESIQARHESQTNMSEKKEPSNPKFAEKAPKNMNFPHFLRRLYSFCKKKSEI
jgi:hypothetical protein